MGDKFFFSCVFMCACICIHSDCQTSSERTLKRTEGRRVISSLFVVSSLFVFSVLLPRLLPPPHLYDIILISPAPFLHVFIFNISSSSFCSLPSPVLLRLSPPSPHPSLV